MTLNRERAKSVWMLSFGDLITLLITFFILMIVLNKGEITHIQKWAENQLDLTAEQLSTKLKDSNVISVSRNIQGVIIDIDSNNFFLKGGYQPSELLVQELKILAEELSQTSLFLAKDILPAGIESAAKKGGFQFYREIRISGHTDNVPINPLSPLKNNWFLSSMRAQSVMNQLYNITDLPREFFSFSGYGKYRPIADNSTTEGKEKNRRIQILIVAHFELKPSP